MRKRSRSVGWFGLGVGLAALASAACETPALEGPWLKSDQSGLQQALEHALLLGL